MNKRTYTKRGLDNMITTQQYSVVLYDLVIVPKELAKVIEIELDNGFVMAKTENVISTVHKFNLDYIYNQIEEKRPDILCASESTYIDEMWLPDIINTVKNKKQSLEYNTNNCMCYST